MKTPDNVRKYQREYQYRKGVKCLVCEKPITRQAQYCNKHTPHKPSPRGENHYGWKGGRHTMKSGYIQIWALGYSKNQTFEHIFVWEQANGKVPEGWQVHHINGVRGANRLENLIALPRKSHKHSSPTKLLLKKAQARIKELETKLNNQLHF